jgi:hypothetical protein
LWRALARHQRKTDPGQFDPQTHFKLRT